RPPEWDTPPAASRSSRAGLVGEVTNTNQYRARHMRQIHVIGDCMETDKSVMKWMRVLGLALVMAALAAFAFANPSGLRAVGDNAVANGDFENSTTGWACKSCTLSVGAPAQNGAAGQFTTTSRTARAQLSQSNIVLQPNT